jgi:hypothetical protein
MVVSYNLTHILRIGNLRFSRMQISGTGVRVCLSTGLTASLRIHICNKARMWISICVVLYLMMIPMVVTPLCLGLLTPRGQKSRMKERINDTLGGAYMVYTRELRRDTFR